MCIEFFFSLVCFFHLVSHVSLVCFKRGLTVFLAPCSLRMILAQLLPRLFPFSYSPAVLRPDYMIMHLPLSAQGLFFLSGACISGSVFSFCSTYSLILEASRPSTRAGLLSVSTFSVYCFRLMPRIARNVGCLVEPFMGESLTGWEYGRIRCVLNGWNGGNDYGKVLRVRRQDFLVAEFIERKRYWKMMRKHETDGWK